MDDINAAIRTAWDMLGKPSSASLKFHRETKLLIARGTEEELKLVAAHSPPARGGLREGPTDLAWCLINSSEFLYRH